MTATRHDVEQLAMFMNGRDTQESGTARWDKLPINARHSYLQEASAILVAIELLGWKPAPTTTTAIGDATGRAVQVTSGGDGRESWSLSLSSDRYTNSINMTPAEARLVYDVLGDAIADAQDDHPFGGQE